MQEISRAGLKDIRNVRREVTDAYNALAHLAGHPHEEGLLHEDQVKEPWAGGRETVTRRPERQG